MKKALLRLAPLLVVSAGGLGLYGWYFRTAVHTQSVSPSNRWVVVITKRMERFVKPVEIRVQVIQNGETPRIGLDGYLDAPDVWSDVKPESYRVQWQSDEEFLVGGQHPAGGFLFRGKHLTPVWLVEPLKNETP